MQIRTLHAYIGMLIAPSVLFLTFTGLLQIYGLHEAHGSYTPPAVIAELSAVHKDQHFVTHDDHDDGPHNAAPHDHEAPDHDAAPPHHDHDEGLGTARVLLKAFFASVAAGLFLSTSLGMWMALRQRAKRTAHLILLAIGTFVPAILAALAT